MRELGQEGAVEEMEGLRERGFRGKWVWGLRGC